MLRKKSTIEISVAILLLIFFPFCALVSHELWISREGDFYTLHYGHLQSQTDGEREMDYDPRWYASGLCFQNNAPVPLRAQVKHNKNLFSGHCDYMVILLKDIYYTKTPYGIEKRKKNEVRYSIKSWISRESVKSLFVSGSYEPAGKGLEITPRGNTSTYRVDHKITLLVTENGKPLSDLPVSLHGSVRGTTNSHGEIHIRIREKGIEVFQTSKVEKLRQPDADERITTATLTFEVDE